MWKTYALRGLILATSGAVMIRGDVLYALFCLVALGITMIAARVARTARARTPLELELVLLLIMVGDMTLGNLLGLYVTLPWYDKVVHLGSSVLLGWIGFLSIYVLHATGRTQLRPWLAGVGILLVTLGIGAVWEIAEYGVDHLLGRATQGSPVMSPHDDTMFDLILDAAGGLVAAVLGPLYIQSRSRSRARMTELVERVSQRRLAVR